MNEFSHPNTVLVPLSKLSAIAPNHRPLVYAVACATGTQAVVSLDELPINSQS